MISGEKIILNGIKIGRKDVPVLKRCLSGVEKQTLVVGMKFLIEHLNNQVLPLVKIEIINSNAS